LSSYGGTFSRGGKDPAYQELYTRMFQFGTFCPIFRSHGSETPREMWLGMRWDDAHRRLVLEDRQGQFPGMLKTRTFQVVLVREGHGAGVEGTPGANRALTYDGTRPEAAF